MGFILKVSEKQFFFVTRVSKKDSMGPHFDEGADYCFIRELPPEIAKKTLRWNFLLPEGKWFDFRYSDKPDVITKEKLLTAAKNYAKTGMHVAGDYDHVSVGLVPDAKAEDMDSVGEVWGVKVFYNSETKRNELWGLIDWIDEAKKKIDEGKRRYISPEYWTDYPSKTSGKSQGLTITGFALLGKDPWFDNQPLVAAKDIQASPSVAKIQSQEGRRKNMELEKLIEVLGLDKTATEEDVLSAIREKHEKSGEVERLEGELQTAKAEGVKVKKLEKELEGLRAKKAETETEKKTVEERVKKLEGDLETASRAIEAAAKKSLDDRFARLKKQAADEGRATVAELDAGRKFFDTDPDLFEKQILDRKKNSAVDMTEKGGPGVTQDGLKLKAEHVERWKKDGIADPETHYRKLGCPLPEYYCEPK